MGFVINPVPEIINKVAELGVQLVPADDKIVADTVNTAAASEGLNLAKPVSCLALDRVRLVATGVTGPRLGWAHSPVTTTISTRRLLALLSRARCSPKPAA